MYRSVILAQGVDGLAVRSGVKPAAVSQFFFLLPFADQAEAEGAAAQEGPRGVPSPDHRSGGHEQHRRRDTMKMCLCAPDQNIVCPTNIASVNLVISYNKVFFPLF